MCAFLHFCSVKRPQLAEENPTLGVGGIARQLTSEWRLMTPEQRKPFNEVAEREKERYEEQKQAYEAGYLAGYCAAVLQRDAPSQDGEVDDLASGSGVDPSVVLNGWGINRFSALELERQSGRTSHVSANELRHNNGIVASRPCQRILAGRVDLTGLATEGNSVRSAVSPLISQGSNSLAAPTIGTGIRTTEESVSEFSRPSDIFPSRTGLSRSATLLTSAVSPATGFRTVNASVADSGMRIASVPNSGSGMRILSVVSSESGMRTARTISGMRTASAESGIEKTRVSALEGDRLPTAGLEDRSGEQTGLFGPRLGSSGETGLSTSELGRDANDAFSLEMEEEDGSDASAFRFDGEMCRLSVLESVGESSVASALALAGQVSTGPEGAHGVNVRRMPLLSPVKRTKLKKRKSNPNLPRRSMSAFLFYSLEHRARMKAQNPSFGAGKLAQCLAECWKEMGPSERRPFEQMASKDKERYKEEVKALKMGQYGGTGVTPREVARSVTGRTASASPPAAQPPPPPPPPPPAAGNSNVVID